MTEPSGSSHPRDAFAVLVAARPQPPAELTSPDTPDADELFRRIVADAPAPRSQTNRRRHFSLAVCAAAAAAVVGILLTVPGRDGPSSVGSADTTTPAPLGAATPATVGAPDWPSIAQSPPVGDANTSRATLIRNGDLAFGRTDFTMVDGDVNLGIFQAQLAPDAIPEANGASPPTVGPPVLIAENRYAAGEWYYNFQDENGEMQWSYDPNDEPVFVGVSPSDPRELHDRLAPIAGFEADGADFVRGVETVHLVATTPEAVNPGLLQYDPMVAESIASLDLWVDSNGIVRRVDVQYAGTMTIIEPDRPDAVIEQDTNDTVSIEFYDIGEPNSVDVPRDAVEVDAQG